MKLLKYMVGSVVFLLGVALVASLLMSSEWRVERSAEVNAPPSKVMAYISLLSNWPEWTVWNTSNFPELKTSYSGPNWGVGARQSWDDGAMVGVLEVTDYDPGSFMEYNVDMDNGEFTMQCRLQTDALLSHSKVTWSCWGDTGGSPVDKLMMAAFKPMIGDDFQGGLDKLAARFAEQAN